MAKAFLAGTWHLRLKTEAIHKSEAIHRTEAFDTTEAIRKQIDLARGHNPGEIQDRFVLAPTFRWE